MNRRHGYFATAAVAALLLILEQSNPVLADMLSGEFGGPTAVMINASLVGLVIAFWVVIGKGLAIPKDASFVFLFGALLLSISALHAWWFDGPVALLAMLRNFDLLLSPPFSIAYGTLSYSLISIVVNRKIHTGET